ncbi:MAG: hypothetical protein MK085_01865 [Phycisphaerales bacterium]|nr:hypothetical protein [Phycisphaerales bacterium]
MTILAWIPFMDPMPGVQQTWLWLLVPLVFGISMMYKAARMESVEGAGYWKQAALMTVQVLGVFLALAVGFLLLVQFVVPLLPG